MLEKIELLFKVYLNPDFWFMNHEYSKEWDQEFNELMDKYEFIPIYFTDGITFDCALGDKEIWIKSYPFAIFKSNGGDYPCYRPSKVTIYKGYKKYLKDVNKHKSGIHFNEWTISGKPKIEIYNRALKRSNSVIPDNWDDYDGKVVKL